MSKWISVKKRLPKETEKGIIGTTHSDEVLITVESDALKRKHVETAYLADGKWICLPFDIFDTFGIPYTVTAWRPMPEPYEGGGR